MLKKTVLLLSSLFIFSGLTGCNDDGPMITILGLDKDGKEIEMKISQDKFTDRFSDILNSASVTSINTLQAESNSATKWSLTEAEVGIDLELKGGIESIVSLGVGSGASVTISKEAQTAGAAHE